MPEELPNTFLELLALALLAQVAQQIELNKRELLCGLRGDFVVEKFNLGLAEVEAALLNNFQYL